MRRKTRSGILNSLPHGIIRAAGRIVEMRVGRKMAISKIELIEELGMIGFLADDRKVRACVHELRQQGIPILSSSGLKGYWYPERRNEIDHFLNTELRPRAKDLFASISALEKAASREFGPLSITANQPLLLDLPAIKQSEDIAEAISQNGFG